MQLKLAEYNAEGKFERFLELNMSREGFGYYGDRIVLRRFVKLPEYINKYLDTEDVYDLDQKDPLNRFDGLFDGRTYGGGRFVLVRGVDFNISGDGRKQFLYLDDFYSFGRKKGIVKERPWTIITKYLGAEADETLFNGFSFWSCGLNNNLEILGNIHQNPQLYEK